MGQIITFYSYKGGVGRSFALANVAAQLTLWGYKVLVIDWDLEAPGIHHYFGRFVSPRIEPRALNDRQGLLEYITRWQADPETDWSAFVQKAQFSEVQNTIDLIFAGDQTADYGTRVRSVDWDALYRQHGFGVHLDALGEKWRQIYDFTFIDSRTGLSDTAGICTVQLPDILALVLTASYQSVTGTAWVGAKALEARGSSSNHRGLAFQVPIISRFAEKEEITLAGEWRHRIAEELDDLIKAWRPKGIRADQLIEILKLPHVARWTYGEELPVLEETPDRPEFVVTNTELISYHLQTLAALFAHHVTGIQSLISDRSSYVNRAAQRAIPRGPEAGSSDELVKLLGELQSRASEAAALGDDTLAISYWEDLLAKAESTLGPESPAVLSALRSLSQSMQSVGRLSESESLLRRALNISEKTLGAESPEILGDLNNLIRLLQDVERPSEAELFARRALNIAEQTFGGNHLKTKQARENLELLLKAMMPAIWNVPHPRNPSFTEAGRRLGEIREALRSGQPAALTQALAGLGGVGKTQLAVEYAYRHAGEYAFVWWVRSEQAVTLAADYAALAAALGLPEKDAAEQPAIIAAVREALRHRNDWLLIFDNVNEPAEIRGYLPGGGGHVLITSRHAAWGGVAHTVAVKKWAPEVAVAFLLHRIGATDAAAAGELAGALDCFPLALEQAAAYIETTGQTLAGYLALYRQHALALLERGAPATDYPATVATTWELSFQQLAAEAPAAAALLNLCAFLAPDDIPRDLLTAGAKHLPEPLRAAVADPLAFDDAVAALRRYSLIETGGEATLSLHRLVQIVIRARLGERGQKTWAEAAVEVVNQAFPLESDDVRTWPECARLLPHAIVAADFAEPLGVGLETAARLLNQMGLYAWGRAEYATAKAALERALAIDEKAFGPDHPNVARNVNNLGRVLWALGDLPGAKAVIERALAIDEKAFGPDHPEVARDCNNLGRVLQDLGDLPGAKAVIERALAIDEKAFGPDHPNVARNVNNLGRVLWALGDLPGAKAVIERALAIDEKAFGPDHPNVATDVNNLGSVLQALGDLPGAKAAFERALGIGEKAFGPDHPEVAVWVNNLGSVLRDLGDLPGAKAAFERALAIFRKFLGNDHPNTRRVRRNLESISGDSEEE